MNQPPSFSGTNGLKPYSGPGGSSDSQNSSRMKTCGFHPASAQKFNPMIMKAAKPNTRLIVPSRPR